MLTFLVTFAIAAAIGTYIVSIVMSQIAETNKAGQYFSHGIISPEIYDGRDRMAINIVLIAIAMGAFYLSDGIGACSILFFTIFIQLAVFSALLAYEKSNFTFAFLAVSVLCLAAGSYLLQTATLADFGWATLICAITTPTSILLNMNAEKIYNWLLPVRKFLQTNTFALILGAVSLFFIGLGIFQILYALVGPGAIKGIGFGLLSWSGSFALTYWAMGIGQEYDKPNAIVCAICALICAMMGIVIVLL
jgi:hypothetical protein